MSVVEFLEEDETGRPLPKSLFSMIQEDILDGVLRRGSHLTESSLCERYKVSRTPVRSALALLEADGLVRTEKNRGAFVIGFDRNTIDDMLDLKEYAERLAILCAVDRITDEELDELDELFEFMEFYTMKDDISRMMNINRAFHRMLSRATHDPMLERELNLYQLYVSHLIPDDYERPGYLKEVLDEHRAIYDSIKTRNREAALKAITWHNEQKRKRREHA